MPIETTCPECKARLRIPDSAIGTGQPIHCPRCKAAVFGLPATPAACEPEPNPWERAEAVWGDQGSADEPLAEDRFTEAPWDEMPPPLRGEGPEPPELPPEAPVWPYTEQVPPVAIVVPSASEGEPWYYRFI